jgi:hydroxypyruvate reductase
VLEYLTQGALGHRTESPKPGDATLPLVHSQIVASSVDASQAAVGCARRLGLQAVELGPVLAGEARRLGRRLAALAKAVDASEPHCFVATGESTVTVRGSGSGGRNQELALAAAMELNASTAATLLAAGTDGTDGPTDAAGAYVDGESVARASRLGLDPAVALANNDSYAFFARAGGLLHTGPTSTNVMDLVLMVVPPTRS